MQFRVVIAGAGVAGLETALALRALAEDLVSVELVAPEPEFTYRPLAVAEPFRVGEVKRFPLEPLVAATGGRLRHGAIVEVDQARKSVVLADGEQLAFDAFVIALGAQPRMAVPGALTFRGSQDSGALAEVLDELTLGKIKRVAFVVPAAVTWALPAYELALLTAEYLSEHGARNDTEISLVTPEERPLALFGELASDAIRELLEIRGVRLEADAAAIAWSDGLLRLAGERRLEADAVVALPRLIGPSLRGAPHDHAGFVPVDEFGRVLDTSDLYAAGDVVQFPVKQGGIAAQQADAVAGAIAADAGAAVTPEPIRPVMRGLLLTGMAPRFLRGDIGERSSVIDTEPLWWPPGKIAGRYLTPFLAAHLGLTEHLPESAHEQRLSVEVELGTGGRAVHPSA